MNGRTSLTSPRKGCSKSWEQNHPLPGHQIREAIPSLMSQDNPVIAPWNRLPSPDSVTEQEGIYSEDEYFADTPGPTQRAHRSSSPISPTVHTQNKDLLGTRPSFVYTKAQAIIGPYQLDPTDPSLCIPQSINRFLREYQRAGVRFFYEHYTEGRGGILGDDMGLGKTIQVIAFLSAIMRKSGTDADWQRRKRLVRGSATAVHPRHWPTALIVCPKSLVNNWERELETWGYFEHATWRSENAETVRSQFLNAYLDIIICSLDTVRVHSESIKSLPVSVLIVDEAHRLKEPEAQTTLALKKIECRICFALTGTLIQNRMDEMWSVLDLVWRGWAGTSKEWREFAVNPIKRGHRLNGTAEEVVKGIMRLGLVHEKILPHFYLRRDKRLIADELPEKRDLVVFCPLGIAQISAYQALVDSEGVQFILKRKEACDCGSGEARIDCCHRLTEEGETLGMAVLKYMSALGKVSNVGSHHSQYHTNEEASGSSVPWQRRFAAYCKHASGIRRVLTGCSARSTGGFSGFVDPSNCGKWMVNQSHGIANDWRRDDNDNKVSGFSFDILSGEVEANERQEMVDRFQDPQQDYFILLVSTLAGGVGLNLTAANKVVIFDPSWNPANDLQAMDRAFRIGQKRPVDVYRLIGKGTLEELKYERQIHKQQRARQLNEGTFERRIHIGMEGARNVEDQGELFGSQNIFRFDPNGFVSKNLERIQQAEDKFLQDLLEAEYDTDGVLDDDSEDEAGRKMRDANKLRAKEKAKLVAVRKRSDDDLVRDVLGEGSSKVRKEDDMLKTLHIASHVHDVAFRDSTEEKKIYEIGIKLLRDNPSLARTIKANDLGKLGRLTGGRRKDSVTRVKRERKEESSDEEPWKRRVQIGKAKAKTENLVELSD
ncbi:hypothetical protein TREMEDRAFT_74496 [Tremella mesenterica DSM 1558]|uniref:uncharacterized protein n=1 Tax=Tremella mesenterica (strain ATCC 24925 / CBS 8224 / DSM 1558 / NBRC 9311 / NRRL Y-6157 / RJB 2259-6 / UBC 559-6) TaxID=578456 RepID=UPI0003F48DC0|nr:uncharacterized protein TREMEDRAFT_74496 [Tremella mesenterica DSM 1558]EIW67723.1 hypothetical protein TREMEDRAFT_74496 [Tremella mesenterica DSM 1558]